MRRRERGSGEFLGRLLRRSSNLVDTGEAKLRHIEHGVWDRGRYTICRVRLERIGSDWQKSGMSRTCF
jgi:hypothetical protein